MYDDDDRDVLMEQAINRRIKVLDDISMRATGDPRETEEDQQEEDA